MSKSDEDNGNMVTVSLAEPTSPPSSSIRIHPEGLSPPQGWKNESHGKQANGPAVVNGLATGNGTTQANTDIVDKREIDEKEITKNDSRVVAYILAGFTCVVALLLIILGSTFINDCPAQYLIPVYILVLGVSLFITSIFVLIIKIKPLPDNIVNVGIIISALFMTCWLICGCVWIYGVVHHDEVHPSESYPRQTYCHHFIYKFSVAIVTIYLVAELFMISVACFLCFRGKR